MQHIGSQTAIRLSVIGANPQGVEAFRLLAASLGNVQLTVLPRMSFISLVSWLTTRPVDFGVVLMRQEWAGLLSPSKFAAYLAAGVPLLYLGPAHTNAWKICTEFNAGFAMLSSAQDPDLLIAATHVADSHVVSAFRANVPAARDHFFSFTAKRFVAEVFGLSDSSAN